MAALRIHLGVASCVFEDSLTCLNFGDPARPHPCNECLLMRFVPGRAQSYQAFTVPAHIQLTDKDRVQFN